MSTTTKQTKQAVFRYKLPLIGANTVMMPANCAITAAQILAVKGKGGNPTGQIGVELFALVNVGSDDDLRTFHVARTGEEMPAAEQARFVATVALPGLPALHVFELV